FTGLLMVAVVAFLAPLLLGLSPVLRLPSVVLEIVAGIVIGPSVLGGVKVDLPLSLLSLFGLAFLLFGLEVACWHSLAQVSCCQSVCWLLVVSVGQNWPMRTPTHASCSLPISQRKCTISGIHLLDFTKGMDTVQGMLIFIMQLVRLCLRSFHHR